MMNIVDSNALAALRDHVKEVIPVGHNVDINVFCERLYLRGVRVHFPSPQIGSDTVLSDSTGRVQKRIPYSGKTHAQ